MSANTIDNMSISIEPSSSDQQPVLGHRKDLAPESIQISPEHETNKHNKKEDFETNQISLGQSKSAPWKQVCAFIVFTILSMVVGITTVCLTAPKRTNTTCEMAFTRMVQTEITYDSRPRHVAVADFNQDKYLDLVIANTAIDNIGVRLGYRNGSFANQILYFTGNGSQPYWVAVEDFDNDRLLDIAVANYGTNNIGIFFGDGTGSFANYMTYSLSPSHPVSLAIGDFNSDSQWDIVVVNDGTFDIVILYGTGDGSFRMGTPYFMGYDSMPCSIAVADLNKDNQSDIAVVNYGTSELVIFLSSENDTFTIDKYSTGINSHPSSLTVDYLDSDDYLDIAITNSATHNIGIFIGDMDGKFPLMWTYPASSNSYLQFIVAGQFNNDSKRDLAVVDSSGNYVIIFGGDGNGAFSIATSQSIGYGSTPYSIAVADVDNDNQSDMVVVNNGNNNILLLSFYAFQTIADQSSYPTGSNSVPTFVTVADVNKDGHLDIVVTNTYASNIGVFIGLGNGTFKSQEIVPMLMNVQYPYSLAIGDFNKDGQSDIAVVLSLYNQIDVYFGQGNGSFEFGESYSLEDGSNPISIAISDFNNDNNPDMATANYGANNLAVFLGSSNGTFSVATYYNLTEEDFSPIFIATDDFNKDGFFDLVSANYNSPTITILMGNENGSFEDAVSINLNDYYPFWLVIGDLNNDGRQDIVLTTSSNSIVRVLLGNGNGTFQELYTYGANDGNGVWGAAFGHFHKSTMTDIAIIDPLDSSVVIFLRNFDEHLTKQNTIPIRNDYSPYYIAAGDFNHDTETDLVVANSDDNVITVLLLKYQATFLNQTTYSQGSARHPYSITTGDFDNDHQLDIAVANSGTDNVEILTKYYDGTFRKRIAYRTGDNSYPRCIVAADFDKDYQLDIAIVNYRQNTLMIILNPGDETVNTSFQYPTGAGSFPNALVTGDINKDGWTDVVVTNNNTDNVGVFLGFNYPMFTTGQKIPFQRGSTPDNVAVADFNGDALWDLAIVCQQTSTIEILLGNRDGTFTNQPSYSFGSNPNTISFVIGSFNNDSQLDLAVASSYNQSIYILLGNGDGTFSDYIDQSTDYTSPVFIAAGDLNNDGRQDLVVANQLNDNIGIFFGYGNGSFQEQILYPLPEQSAPIWIVVGDLNNDNISDLVAANLHGNSFGLFLGTSNGTFQNVTIYPTSDASAPSSLAIGDFDKDNSTDIAVLNTGTKNVGIFFGYGNGTFSSQTINASKWNSVLTAMVVEDLNNDTLLDIAITDFAEGTGNIDVFYGLGERRFLIPKVYSTLYQTHVPSMAVKDFNNDSRMDFIVTISKKNTVLIMRQDKSEPFGSSVTFFTGTGSNPSAVALYDFNSDDQLDIAVVNSKTSDIWILLGDGNGQFMKWKTYPTGLNTLPNSIVVGDVDGDKQDDILVTNSNTNEIGIFFSYGNGTFAVVRTYSTGPGSEPSSVLIADLNKDNRMDIVVANTGINTVVVFYGTGNRMFLKSEWYRFGYDDRPRAIVVGDLNNDAWSDIAVANYGSGTVYVLLHTC